jgi:phosphatidylglycerol---prolipoprotein diacylglyceryl transferase
VYPRLLDWDISSIPLLGRLEHLTLYTYGVLLATAYLLGLQLAIWRGRKRGLEQARVMDLGIYIIISALIGAKLLLVVTDPSLVTSGTGFMELVRSGGVFYGGLIVAVIVALLYIRRAGLPLWTTCDVFAPGIALGHVIGRFGCFFAGCCYGKVTTVPWAVTFTNELARAQIDPEHMNQPLHPTQLYEAGAEALILLFLLATESRGKRFAGRTFWLYMLLYAVSRFIIEFFRADPRGTVLSVSTSQFISILLAPLAVVMLFYLRRRESPAPKSARKAA